MPLPNPPTFSARRPALAATALLALVTSSAEAHLSIIRQGPESRDAMEALDRHGETVCTGDFNGDGFEDLATSAPYEDVSGFTGNDNGVVIINWGSPEGLTHVGSQRVVPPINEHALLFGWSMASADFDNDGFDDLVIGMPFANRSGNADSGLVAVYRGGVLGFVNGPVLYDQSNIGSAVEAGDRWGWALAAGDIDADGYADLCVGSPGENASSGAVTFLFGSVTGLSATGSYSFTQSTIGASNGAGELFGWSIAIGNFKGLNPLPPSVNPNDVAVGIPLNGINSITGATPIGMVAVIGSTNSGPQASLTTLHTPGSLGLATPTKDRAFAHRLAAGDFDQDGYDDLAIGRPGSSSYAGEVIELHGGAFDMSYNATRTSADFGPTPTAGDKFGWALATGDFDEDDFEDLLVGSPGHTQFFFTSMGRTYLYRSTNGLGLASWDHWDQAKLNVDYAAFDETGSAVAFGYFDDSGRANMITTAPGAEGNAGRVHVWAPWRQPGILACRQSIAFDCDDNIVYSQKPFDPVYIASTAKNMTILVACERTQLPTNDPKYVSPNAVYEVPFWVSDQIGGSQFHLQEGELVTLRTLMDMAMSVSGNDAVFAIADLLTGSNAVFNGLFDTVNAFVAEMNARAAQLGMLNTTFTNPAGFAEAGPESTAYEMAILGRAAMKNPLFEAVVNNKSWQIPRTIPTLNGGYYSFTQPQSGGFVAGLQNLLPQATGAKDGGSSEAQLTGVFTAREEFYPWGTAYGSSFNTPWSAQWVSPGAAQLLTLGLDRCFNGPIVAAPVDPPAQQSGPVTAQALNMYTTSFYPPDPVKKQVQLEVHNLVLDGLDTEVELAVQRESTAAVPDLSTVFFRTDNVTGHDGVTLVFEGGIGSSMSVTTNTVGNPVYNLFLLPGDEFEVPAASLPSGVTSFAMSIWASSAQFAHLRITESYSEDLVLNDGLGGAAPAKKGLVFHRDGSGSVTPHAIDVVLTGQDTDPGHLVGLALHELDFGYVYDPCPARTENYGAGWNGGQGVPVLTTDAAPVLGSDIVFRLGNSVDAPTSGFWAIGLQKHSLATSLDGTLNVKPLVVVPVAIPKSGLEFPYSVPTDPLLCGVSFYHQLFVADGDASQGLAFSRGLKLTLGN